MALKIRKKLFYLFFFQAEDGIRDCLLSRGLGDVYKRQVQIIIDRTIYLPLVVSIISNVPNYILKI